MKLKVLKNGFEKNLEMPAKKGDVGYDLRAASLVVQGKTFSSTETSELDCYYQSIDFIEYNTGIALEPFTNSPELISNSTKTDSGFEWIQEDKTDITKYIQVKPRSSLSNYNLSLKNHVATIDPNFRGTIKCRFSYLWQPEDLLIVNGELVGKINKNKIFNIGDKIAQCVFANVIHPEIVYVDKLSDSERNSDQFGSTGR